ncbi:MAG: sugar kinase [Microcoleaceae cyanobacterium]
MTASPRPQKQGLFVGLSTLDLIYQVSQYPTSNQKVVASDSTVAAGGPATNAAVTFSYLKNRAILLSVFGAHPITALMQTDLRQRDVVLLDLQPRRRESPPVSSIIVTAEAGDRAVVSINATKAQASPQSIPNQCLRDIKIVLIDGHQISVSEAIGLRAKAKGIPVVLDGGSWKPGLEKVLPHVNYAICSANFHPPGCQTQSETLDYLEQFQIPAIAITHGERPIQFLERGKSGNLPVPQVRSVDTLGAGDVFHGAFCHYILEMPFLAALESAAQIAARSCQFFGTRQWMEKT